MKRKRDVTTEKSKWTDNEAQVLIELLEEQPNCLWHIYSNDYTKREQKEKAYKELAEDFETTSANVKSKISALRAQLGREIAKE